MKIISTILIAAAACTLHTTSVQAMEPYSTWQEWLFFDGDVSPDPENPDVQFAAPSVRMAFGADGLVDVTEPDGKGPPDGSGVVQTLVAASPTEFGSQIMPDTSPSSGVLEIFSGGLAQLDIRNWFDEQPYKTMWIEVLGSNLQDLDLKFFDAQNFGGVTLPGPGEDATLFDSTGEVPREGFITATTQNENMVRWDFMIFPNPDFEQFDLVNGSQDDAQIMRIEVHTVSAPEPGTYAMLGMTLAIAGVVRRRKQCA